MLFRSAHETIFHPRDDMQADAMSFRDGFRHDIARAERGINCDPRLVRECLTAPEWIAATPRIDINDVEIIGRREVHGRGDRVLGRERISREPSGTDFTRMSRAKKQRHNEGANNSFETKLHQVAKDY